MRGRRIVWGVMLSVILVSFGLGAPVAAETLPVFAQEEDAPPGGAEETPADLPHLKFLLDYVLVLALFAAALYAVGRSSRRR